MARGEAQPAAGSSTRSTAPGSSPAARRAGPVQIGLCLDGVPSLGVVAEPAAGRVTWAIRTASGWDAGQREGDGPPSELGLSNRTRSELQLIGGRAFPFSRQKAIRNALSIPSARAGSVGSVGVRMTSIARGDADLYVQAPGKTKLWDTCAPLCLVQAAGGVVTDFAGGSLEYQGGPVTHPRGVLACRPQDQAAVLTRLAPLAEAWIAS